MTLQTFSATTSMSMSDMNEELGRDARSPISMSQVANRFGGLINNQTSNSDKYPVDAFEFRELYGLTLGQLEATDITIFRLYNNSLTRYEGWGLDEGVECAEGIRPYGETNYTSPVQSLAGAVEKQAGIAGNLSTDDKLYTGQTAGVANGTAFPLPSAGTYLMNSTTNEIFTFASDAGDSLVKTIISRTPASSLVTTATTESVYRKTDTQIMTRSTSNSVTRTIRTQKTTPGGTVTQTGTATTVGGSDFTPGNQISFLFTGLTADTTYTFRSRGENNFANGSYSSTQIKTYKNATIGITPGADGGVGDGSDGTETLDYLTVTVTNGNGTHAPYAGASNLTFPYLVADDNTYVKYRQSTTTTFTGDFITPTEGNPTNVYGDALTLNGSNTVYIQPQITTAFGFNAFTTTFYVIDGHKSGSFTISETPGPPTVSNDGTRVDTSTTSTSFNFYSDVITITLGGQYDATKVKLIYNQRAGSQGAGYAALSYREASSASDKLTSGGGSAFDGNNNTSNVDASLTPSGNKVYLQFFGQVFTTQGGSVINDSYVSTIKVEVKNSDESQTAFTIFDYGAGVSYTGGGGGGFP